MTLMSLSQSVLQARLETGPGAVSQRSQQIEQRE